LREATASFGLSRLATASMGNPGYAASDGAGVEKGTGYFSESCLSPFCSDDERVLPRGV
jgi:hypothetical protein